MINTEKKVDVNDEKYDRGEIIWTDHTVCDPSAAGKSFAVDI